jgi:hypothetical protein
MKDVDNYVPESAWSMATETSEMDTCHTFGIFVVA